VDIPIGNTTLERSHNPSVFLNSSITALGRSSLGINWAIESATCVGAAKRVEGARAKTSEMVVVKIIFGDRYGYSGTRCGEVLLAM
jgi:hypothetical protein